MHTYYYLLNVVQPQALFFSRNELSLKKKKILSSYREILSVYVRKAKNAKTNSSSAPFTAKV